MKTIALILYVVLFAVLVVYVSYSMFETADYVGAVLGENDRAIQKCVASGGSPVMMLGLRYEGCAVAASK